MLRFFKHPKNQSIPTNKLKTDYIFDLKHWLISVSHFLSIRFYAETNRCKRFECHFK